MSKKILFCTPFDLSKGGGIARCSRHIFDYFKKCGCDDIVLDVLPMDRKYNVSADSSFFKRFHSGVSEYWRIIKKIQKKVKTKRYDIVHIASSASLSLFKDYLCVKMLKKMNIASIIHFHFGRIPEVIVKDGWEWRMIKKVAKYATRIIVIDQSSYDVLIRQGIKNVDYLPNALSPTTEILANRFSVLPRSENTILFVGHVIKTKGVYELIEACGEIPSIKLKILGLYHEKIKEDLIKSAYKYPKKNWIEFTGNLPAENVIKEMCQCTIFALPTYTEGFPNVILESMACACPIVTTKVGAIPEMLDIKNGDNNGICISPQNVEDLRNAILHMLNNPKYAKFCGNNAKRRVTEMYSMHTIWKNMCNIWNCCSLNN